MRKIIVVVVLMMFTLSCKQQKEEIINNKYEPVTFKELDSVNSKSIIEIKEYLKKKGFVFLTKQSDSEQWKLENKDDIIQFNGEGILLYLTTDKNASNSIVKQLKESNYNYTGKSNKDGTDVDSYSKENQTLLVSTLIYPETNQNVYSFTFLNRTN